MLQTWKCTQKIFVQQERLGAIQQAAETDSVYAGYQVNDDINGRDQYLCRNENDDDPLEVFALHQSASTAPHWSILGRLACVCVS